MSLQTAALLRALRLSLIHICETLEEIAAREAAQKEAQAQTLLQAQDGKASEKAGRTGGRNIENSGAVPAGTSDAILLAALIQCEAGSEIYEGQLAVGAVVILSLIHILS